MTDGNADSDSYGNDGYGDGDNTADIGQTRWRWLKYMHRPYNADPFIDHRQTPGMSIKFTKVKQTIYLSRLT